MTTHFFFTGLSNGRLAFIGWQFTIFLLCSTYGPSGLQAWPSAGPHPICFLALIPASLLFIILCYTGLSNGRLALSWPPGRSIIMVAIFTTRLCTINTVPAACVAARPSGHFYLCLAIILLSLITLYTLCCRTVLWNYYSYYLHCIALS